MDPANEITRALALFYIDRQKRLANWHPLKTEPCIRDNTVQYSLRNGDLRFVGAFKITISCGNVVAVLPEEIRPNIHQKMVVVGYPYQWMYDGNEDLDPEELGYVTSFLAFKEDGNVILDIEPFNEDVDVYMIHVSGIRVALE